MDIDHSPNESGTGVGTRSRRGCAWVGCSGWLRSPVLCCFSGSRRRPARAAPRPAWPAPADHGHHGAADGQSSTGDAGSNNDRQRWPSGTAIVGANGAAALAFSQCMRAHGVADFPDPNAQGQTQISGGLNSDLNPNNPTFQKAQNACQSKLPKPSPAQQAQALKNALKMSQCMRAHGITDFPDPQSGQGGRISMSLHGSPGSDLNPNDPRLPSGPRRCACPTRPACQGGKQERFRGRLSTGGGG